MAKHPKLFESEQDRDQYIRAIQCLADREGLHLVEHLLLRPRGRSFRFTSEETGKALFESSGSFKDDQEAVGQLQSILDRIIDGEEVVEPFSEPEYGYRLVDADGDELAACLDSFESEEQRDEAVKSLLAYVEAQFDEPASREPAALMKFVSGSGKFLPVGDGCRGDEGKLCPVRADNYSFRATVVVPYWPSRYRSNEFRRFFERTIRTETPGACVFAGLLGGCLPDAAVRGSVPRLA